MYVNVTEFFVELIGQISSLVFLVNRNVVFSSLVEESFDRRDNSSGTATESFDNSVFSCCLSKFVNFESSLSDLEI